MEHITMLENSNLMSSTREIYEASNASEMKVMIREFTVVYTRTLSLLVSGNVAPAKCEMYFLKIRDVANYLMDILPSAVDEGVVVQLVRFIDAMLTAHNSSDLSSHQHIVEMEDVMLKKCIAVLLQLVKEPHVGGSSLCLALNALFKVARYNSHLRLTLTDVAETLINSALPNLFGHNIRSLHKRLIINLWRLIKITEETSFQKRLSNLMIRAIVKKNSVERPVSHVAKKRSIHDTDNVTTESQASNTPHKRQKVTVEDAINLSYPLMYNGNFSKDSKHNLNAIKQIGHIYKPTAYSESPEHSDRGARLSKVSSLLTSATHLIGAKSNEGVLDHKSLVRSSKHTSVGEKLLSQAEIKTITKEGLTDAPAATGNLYATSPSSSIKQQRSTEENTSNLSCSVVFKDQPLPIVVIPTSSHTIDKYQCVDQKQKKAQLSGFWLRRHSLSPRHGSTSKSQYMNDTPQKSRPSGYWLCGTAASLQHRPRRLEDRMAEYSHNLCSLG